jgi:hypothetical protein
MSTQTTIEPVRRSVGVDLPVADAFRLFTEEIGSWWPMETHAIAAGSVKEVVWEQREGGEVYELAEDGAKAHWADVLVWEPPHRFVLAWKVNPEAPAATEVEVRFTAYEDTGTRVELEHRAWERLGELGEAARAGYDTGWEMVLGRYVAGARTR